jgi:hypothetical protein
MRLELGVGDLSPVRRTFGDRQVGQEVLGSDAMPMRFAVGVYVMSLAESRPPASGNPTLSADSRRTDTMVTGGNTALGLVPVIVGP